MSNRRKMPAERYRRHRRALLELEAIANDFSDEAIDDMNRELDEDEARGVFGQPT